MLGDTCVLSHINNNTQNKFKRPSLPCHSKVSRRVWLHEDGEEIFRYFLKRSYSSMLSGKTDLKQDRMPYGNRGRRVPCSQVGKICLLHEAKVSKHTAEARGRQELRWLRREVVMRWGSGRRWGGKRRTENWLRTCPALWGHKNANQTQVLVQNISRRGHWP